jgi:ABC-type phosphate transport system substrate-binding protein
MRRSTLPVTRTIALLIGLALSAGAGTAAAEVVAVVSARNPVTTLSRNQVADIFLGKSTRFPDGSAAVPIDQLESSAVRDEFYFKFADKSPAQIKAYWAKIIFTGRGQPPREVSGGLNERKLVADTPNAIGYIEQGMVDSSVRVLLQQ